MEPEVSLGYRRKKNPGMQPDRKSRILALIPFSYPLFPTFCTQVRQML